jgi:hypothetical protein
LKAEREALLVKAEALNRKQALEKQEAQLKAQNKCLELEAEILANSAKMNVFHE